MKKIFFLMCVLCSTVYAQAQGISYGPKAGLTLSSVIGVKNLSPDFKQGIHAGMFLKADFILIAIQPELLFSQKGYTASTNNTDVNARYNYLDVPVLLRLKMFPGFSADIGPQYSYLISQSSESTPQGGATVKSTDLDSFNRSEIGGVVGLNIQILKVGVSARYTLGFMEVSKGSEMYNTALMFALSYKL